MVRSMENPFGLVLVDSSHRSSGPKFFFSDQIENDPRFDQVRDFIEDRKRKAQEEGRQLVLKHVKALRFGSTSSVQHSMTTLVDLMHDFEYAQYFVELKGHLPLLEMISNSHDSWELTNDAEVLLKQCFAVLGTAAQNNPFVTETLVKSGALQYLLKTLQFSQRFDPSVQSSTIFSLSCILRSTEEAMELFLRLDGMSIVYLSLDQSMSRISREALRLREDRLIREIKVVHKLFGIIRDLVELRGYSFDSKGESEIWCYRVHRALFESVYKDTFVLREDALYLLQVMTQKSTSKCSHLLQTDRFRSAFATMYLKSYQQRIYRGGHHLDDIGLISLAFENVK